MKSLFTILSEFFTGKKPQPEPPAAGTGNTGMTTAETISPDPIPFYTPPEVISSDIHDTITDAGEESDGSQGSTDSDDTGGDSGGWDSGGWDSGGGGGWS